MKYTSFVVALLLAVSVNAQSVENIDEHVTYTNGPQYDSPQDGLDQSQSTTDLEQIEEYLKERDEAARHEHRKKQSPKSKIGIGRDPLGFNRRIQHRKCRNLWRLGLKCR